MCRFAPIAPSSDYLTTLWCLAGGFPRLVLRPAPSRTLLRPCAALAHRHPASLQLSIHHLPVRRLDCQFGCLNVWQKRHAPTPNAPPRSALSCPAASVSAARLCSSISESRFIRQWEPFAGHKFSVPASRAKWRLPHFHMPIQAAEARKPRIPCWAPVQRTKGILHKWEPGSRLSAASPRFRIRREKHLDGRIADLCEPALTWSGPAAHTSSAAPPPCCSGGTSVRHAPRNPLFFLWPLKT